jgi:class 3 adenylate cyclase
MCHLRGHSPRPRVAAGELSSRTAGRALGTCALLAAFFDEMRQQVESYGGTVEKYAGDAIMAVFGVPQVHEDDVIELRSWGAHERVSVRRA